MIIDSDYITWSLDKLQGTGRYVCTYYDFISIILDTQTHKQLDRKYTLRNVEKPQYIGSWYMKTKLRLVISRSCCYIQWSSLKGKKSPI